MCQFSDSGAPSLGSQHGMKFAYSALEGALPAIVDEVAQCGLHLVPEALAYRAPKMSEDLLLVNFEHFIFGTSSWVAG